MEEIQRLEDRNKFLNNEIARLNTSKPTAEEKRKIEGNFEEIEKINK